METKLKALCICMCLLLIFSGAASAKQLSVKKIVQNTDIKTGDSVNISLEFANPFNKPVPVTIQDNNVLGNNGLEIQCYQYTLPDNPDTTVSYDFPIQAFSAGDFTLDSASVTYENPDTGSQETIKSEPVKISIKQGASSGQQQGVTSIYNCNGVSMRSTSYSSSGSTSISISSGQIPQNNQIGGQNQQPGQNQQSPGNIQQTASDMQNLRDQMNRQQQNYQNMQNELRSRIENNSDFKRMEEELEKQGYALTNQSIKPESNDTGDFEYQFNKDNGSANISGRMNAGKMESINKQSTEDIKKIQKYIESNGTFQRMQKELIDKGYNLSSKNIDIKSNISSFEYSYNNSQDRAASITGNVTDAGEIKDIFLNEPEQPLPYWLLIFLAVPLIGMYVYKKYWNNSKIPAAESVPEVHIDPKEEALARLEKAVGLFNNGLQREAYVEASSAVRTYLRGMLGVNELTSDEILKSIRGSKDEKYIEDVRHCFMYCDLVKFAKYEPNSEDFNKVVEHAKRIITI